MADSKVPPACRYEGTANGQMDTASPASVRDVTGSPTELPEGPEAGGEASTNQKNFNRSKRLMINRLIKS